MFLADLEESSFRYLKRRVADARLHSQSQPTPPGIRAGPAEDPCSNQTKRCSLS